MRITSIFSGALMASFIVLSIASTDGEAVRRDNRATADPDREPECRMGSDGRQACGFNCKMGSDGVMVCADTPDGVCAMGSSGHVTCSELAPRRSRRSRRSPRARRTDEREPECRMGSDGRQACGFNCKMGSDGVMVCANTPDGVCAMGSGGHVTCSELAPRRSRRSPRANEPKPRCRMGSDGIQACGYNCRMGSNGHMYCASRPDGRCRMSSDGSFSCP